MAFEFGDSQFRDVSSSGIPDRYVDKKKGHFNRIYNCILMIWDFKHFSKKIGANNLLATVYIFLLILLQEDIYLFSLPDILTLGYTFFL